MNRLPIERAVTRPDESREWNAVPCQRCRTVRTFHVSAVCATCRTVSAGEDANHQARVERARGVHGTWMRAS